MEFHFVTAYMQELANEERAKGAKASSEQHPLAKKFSFNVDSPEIDGEQIPEATILAELDKAFAKREQGTVNVNDHTPDPVIPLGSDDRACSHRQGSDWEQDLIESFSQAYFSEESQVYVELQDCYSYWNVRQPFYRDPAKVAEMLEEFLLVYFERLAEAGLFGEADEGDRYPDLMVCQDPPALCAAVARVLSRIKTKVVPLFVFSGTGLHTALQPYSKDQAHWQEAFMRYHLQEEGPAARGGKINPVISTPSRGGFGAEYELSIPIFWGLQSFYLSQLYAHQAGFQNPVLNHGAVYTGFFQGVAYRPYATLYPVKLGEMDRMLTNRRYTMALEGQTGGRLVVKNPAFVLIIESKLQQRMMRMRPSVAVGGPEGGVGGTGVGAAGTGNGGSGADTPPKRISPIRMTAVGSMQRMRGWYYWTTLSGAVERTGPDGTFPAAQGDQGGIPSFPPVLKETSAAIKQWRQGGAGAGEGEHEAGSKEGNKKPGIGEEAGSNERNEGIAAAETTPPGRIDDPGKTNTTRGEGSGTMKSNDHYLDHIPRHESDEVQVILLRPGDLDGRASYQTFGFLHAALLLPYAAMQTWFVELYSIGMPLFVPSPRAMAAFLGKCYSYCPEFQGPDRLYFGRRTGSSQRGEALTEEPDTSFPSKFDLGGTGTRICLLRLLHDWCMIGVLRTRVRVVGA